MGKTIIKVNEKDLNAHEVALLRAKKALGEKCVCCILISCSETTNDREMQVEMHFDGDESLAAFLLESANQVFDEKFSERESK